MTKKDKEIERIYKSFLKGDCSLEELQKALQYIEENGEDSALSPIIDEIIASTPVLSDAMQARVNRIVNDTDELLDATIASIPAESTVVPMQRSFPYKAWLLVASILVCISFGVLYFYKWRAPIDTLTSAAYGGDVSPGEKKATLYLSDGSSFQLKPGSEGLIMNDQQVTYKDGEILVPDLTATQATIYSPRGGEYKIQLADGSEVWLNADSKLTYPLAFSANSREVEIDGEAYFRVQHLPNKPFIVRNKGQRIRVVGTEFSVNNYDALNKHITLVSGRVKVDLDGQGEVALSPGQQLLSSQGKNTIQEVNTEAYIGWKDGMFIFHDMLLSEVLLQLARWYSIEIPDKGIPQVKVFGEISRNTKLSDVLRLLETATDVRFKIQERRLTIITE